MKLLETNRLFVRKFTPEDGEDLREYQACVNEVHFKCGVVATREYL